MKEKLPGRGLFPRSMILPKMDLMLLKALMKTTRQLKISLKVEKARHAHNRQRSRRSTFRSHAHLQIEGNFLVQLHRLVVRHPNQNPGESNPGQSHQLGKGNPPLHQKGKSDGPNREVLLADESQGPDLAGDAGVHHPSLELDVGPSPALQPAKEDLNHDHQIQEAGGGLSPSTEIKDQRAAPLAGRKGPDRETEADDLNLVLLIGGAGHAQGVEGGDRYFAVVRLIDATGGRGNQVTLRFSFCGSNGDQDPERGAAQAKLLHDSQNWIRTSYLR